MNQKTKNIIQFGLLGLILIILPAGSWIYLKKGLEYQKGTRADLQSLGTYDTRSLFEVPDDVWQKWALEEKLKVVFYWHDDKQKDLLLKFHKQFKNSQGLAFIVLQDETQTELIGIDENVYQIKLSKERIAEVLKDMGKINTTAFSNDYPYFILLDQKNTIKKFYDFKNQEEVKRLIEHIAILVPKAGR